MVRASLIPLDFSLLCKVSSSRAQFGRLQLLGDQNIKRGDKNDEIDSQLICVHIKRLENVFYISGDGHCNENILTRNELNE